MAAKDILSILRANSYPGRGIVLGMSADGARSVVVYFIMGRSENSRNRVFAKTGDGFRTEAFNPAKMTDPSLVIYHPLRVCSDAIIVTNGDQTDTIAGHINDESGSHGHESNVRDSHVRDSHVRGSNERDNFRNEFYRKSFHAALMTREFEPDPPIYTPRISGLVLPGGGYIMSILKSGGGDPSCCCRFFFDYSSAAPGAGHFISTYMSDGDPPPSFEGEPLPVGIRIEEGLEAFAHELWDALDPGNKVSLYARETLIDTGESSEVIINRNR